MTRHGKQYSAAQALVEVNRMYDLQAALQLLPKTSYVKFDPTVELHVSLGLDPKKPDQQIRGTVNLPHGTGKSVRVLVFTKADQVDAALAAGADFAGEEEYIEKIKKGWLEFDVAVATPDMMPKIGQLGRTLGTKGLMPSPKAGTVTTDVAKVVGELKAGRVEFKLEKHPLVHTILGKLSFGQDKLFDNLTALIGAINRAKPTASKGVYLLSASINVTMGPGISLDVQQLRAVR